MVLVVVPNLLLRVVFVLAVLAPLRLALLLLLVVLVSPAACRVAGLGGLGCPGSSYRRRCGTAGGGAGGQHEPLGDASIVALEALKHLNQGAVRPGGHHRVGLLTGREEDGHDDACDLTLAGFLA